MTDRKGVAAFGAILLAHAAITTITWRDIARRADGQVRGSKKAWRIASALNTGGSLAYLVAGRRRLPADRPRHKARELNKLPPRRGTASV